VIRIGDVWNALTANIAVLDAHGMVVGVNDAWKRFARANGAPDSNFYVGTSYLGACEAAAARGDPTAQKALSAVRAALAGEVDEIAIEYPCHSLSEERWFVLRVTRLEGHEGAVVAHENITARRRAEQALRETEQTLRQVLETLPVGVWMMDAAGRIVHGNPAGLRIWGGARYVAPEEFGEYKGWWVSTGKPIAAEEWAAARAIRNGETSVDEEIEIECFDGTRKIILNSAVPLRDAGGAIHGAIIVNQDITARKRAERELEAASLELEEALSRERVRANVDGLTGAANRRHFYELAEQELAVAKRYRQPMSLILFDLDHFKQINDTLGHQAGDEILQRVASTVRTHLRHADVLARYGGEEFIVLLPQTSATPASIVAERMREDVTAQSVAMPRGPVGITISCGVAALSSPDDTLDDLIRRADEALYSAKREGRNRTVLFSRP
jgi:diguanylate cyclase (GGDEF)-like protein/PAS domain S-box-containing protein